MTLVFYTCIVSPHQLPLAYEFIRQHPEVDFKYVYTQGLPPDATKRGWEWHADEPWMVDARKDPQAAQHLLESADLVYSTERDLELFSKRVLSAKKTLYMSERWFKPMRGIPGWLRLLHPRYLKLANGITKLLATSDKIIYLPVGRSAAKDMGLMLHLFGRKAAAPFEPWAYFVNRGSRKTHDVHAPLRVLWVGRMLRWKRVDTLIKAVRLIYDTTHKKGKHCPLKLTLVGQGPERKRLENMARGLPVEFMDGVPIERVRELMRTNDVYVLPSDGGEGWGAALGEALEEGMIAIGTHEAGASSVLLPASHLFQAGDCNGLSKLLQDVINGNIRTVGNDGWRVENAIERFWGIS